MGKPLTIRELLVKSQHDPAYFGWRQQLAERVEAVLKLHRKENWNRFKGDDSANCKACKQTWPCSTRLALNGEA